MHHVGFNVDHGGLHYSEILGLSKLADELGFDSASFYDHLYSLSNEKELCLETWSLLPALALNTKKVKLLPLVTNNLFRHPGVLAKMAATVDNLSGGRLIFGIGAGWYEKEAIDFGYSFPDLRSRIEMLDESIEIVSRLWRDERTTFSGRQYKLEDAESLPKPVQKPHPPILVGGKVGGVLKVAAKYADMCNFTLRNLGGVEGCAKKIRKIDGYCNELGRDPGSISKTVSGICFFAESEQELEAELREDAARRGMTEDEIRAFFRSSAIFGTVEEVVEEIKRYEGVGVDGVMLRFYKPKQAEKARLFSKAVMPKIRGIESP